MSSRFCISKEMPRAATPTAVTNAFRTDMKKPVACSLDAVHIDGRNGSNACTIISTLVMRNVLQPPLLTLSQMWVWNTCVRKCTRETRATTCWVGIDF